MPASGKSATLEQLIENVGSLRTLTQAMEQSLASELAPISLAHQRSAKNLLHYLALRQHDLRELQSQLSRLGLSSLGRSEAHVLASLNAVWEALHSLAARRPPASTVLPPPVDFFDRPDALTATYRASFGPSRSWQHRTHHGDHAE